MSNNNWKRQKDFSQQDIADRIDGFKMMENLKQLQTGMQIRYISPDKGTGKRTLKMGGVLTFIDPQGRYLKLKSMIPGSTKPWSVQMNNETELYYKEMKRQDEKYQELVKWAGSESNLRTIQRVVGKDKQGQKNIQYVMRNYSGHLANLISNNYDTTKKLQAAQKKLSSAEKRIKYLENKLSKGKKSKKTGMSMLSDSGKKK
jgi:hypothetical protein